MTSQPAPSCIALIVAAGRGSRFAASGAPADGAPKQYRKLGGMAVLRRAALPFLDHPGIDAVRVVIHADDHALYDEAMTGLDLLAPVHGGESRQESVRLGLESLAGQAPASVLIHDAARPFVDAPIIDRSIAGLARHPGAIVAVPLADSLKRGAHQTEGADVVAGAVEREGLWRAQTPQAFRYADILAAHRKVMAAENVGYDRGFTDDAAVLEHAGQTVGLVLGSEDNFKITTEGDLARAERQLLAALGDVRTGFGVDVHAFGPAGEKDHVTLCGLRVPSPRGLVGHSDADVGLHALTDAILACIGDGDIGSHFPPSDPQWKGVDSALFLRHAVERVQAKGGVIAHLDVTVLCELPKVSPHREAMRARIAEIAGVSVGRVSVKATTTEKLGFLGRGEGIAAQAVATVRLPADAF
ncbi:MAG TPA: bifunctional 2-C-methyl-D-erythritol 4-phosphate cytidylyltransferase/2-C-methyl-D-erythritol 2,4-cyclodiphosphate synthase [Alphaproteobacteria bacterium]|jgi:2-C-methyl-D-erythritol 4-phosphate cytidylyltransferase/2-C-methyl-D-erythritol 2,4-cyclodiphosphate synthase